ncbi:MAG: hypothetical protein E7452_10860 [Ruminococcaceae bacterium]|nr:hypothetical protein [Oscillospiraceae bacterium]
MKILKIYATTFKSLLRSRLIPIAFLGMLAMIVCSGSFSGTVPDVINGVNVTSGTVVSRELGAWQNNVVYEGALYPYAHAMYFVIGILLSTDILSDFKRNQIELIRTSRLRPWSWFLGKLLVYFTVCTILGYMVTWLYNLLFLSGADVSFGTFFTSRVIIKQLELFWIFNITGFLCYASVALFFAMLFQSAAVGFIAVTAYNLLRTQSYYVLGYLGLQTDTLFHYMFAPKEYTYYYFTWYWGGGTLDFLGTSQKSMEAARLNLVAVSLVLLTATFLIALWRFKRCKI